MKSEDLISVVVPVYNVSEWLEQCLDSIISQSYTNLEIICIDDASEDNSLEILKKYQAKDSRVTVIKHNKNRGLGLSRNSGLAVAKGKWVHFVDSDDWLEPDSYRKLIEKLNSLDFVPDLLFFQYKKYFISNKKFVNVDYNNKEILYKNLCPKKDVQAFDNWDRYAWLKLHRRQFLTENNITFNNYRCMEDMEYATQLYVNAKSICYTDIYVVNYRKRVGSLITQTLKYLDCKVKSFLYARQAYKKISDDELRYKLLGYDYIQIKLDIEKAWLKNYINLFYVLYVILRINTLDVKNYIYKNENIKSSNQLIEFYPMFVNKYFDGNLYWYRNILSFQNNYSNGKKHKCVTIAGIKMNFRQ